MHAPRIPTDAPFGVEILPGDLFATLYDTRSWRDEKRPFSEPTGPWENLRAGSIVMYVFHNNASTYAITPDGPRWIDNEDIMKVM